MSIPLFHSIASWLLKKRISQIELFMKYPQEVQLEVLNQLIISAKDTEIGKLYGYNDILKYELFRQRVPVQTYEQISPQIERSRQGEKNIFWPTPIKWFAKSSGTTNAKSKFIPVSNESLEDCHYKSGKDLLCLYLNNNPDSKLFTGKSLRLGGSMDLYEHNDTFFGDLSSILIDNAPIWANISSTPSTKVSLMREWEAKLEAIIKETTKENVTSLAGVPSWMLVLLRNTLRETEKQHLLEIWPNLEVYFHGGVSFDPYRAQYRQILPHSEFQYYEVYNASEGFFGIQDQNNSSEMLLMLDYGIFYEFIPLGDLDTFDTEQAIPIWEVEMGKNYAIIISTNAGLWRYLIGDTVRFTAIAPYRIKITGRTKHFINVFGEELIIENTEEAIKRACLQTEAKITDYTVAPVFMSEKDKGGHEWMIEFAKPPNCMNRFAEVLDNTLKTLNSDYETKRYKNLTLLPPKINIAKKQLFYQWLKKNNKLGGQHKVPRLGNQRKLLEELLQMNG